MTLKPLSSGPVLDQYFLEARSKLLDLAAILDRIDRGGNCDDARRQQIINGVRLLLEDTPGRAEAVQLSFSLSYDADWQRPNPRD